MRLQSSQKLKSKGDTLPKYIGEFFCLVAICMGMISCQQNQAVPLPRPYGYPRMELPKSYGYARFAGKDCAFSLAYPDFGEIARYREDSCWVDIYFPPFDATWHVTYRDIRKGKGRDFSQEEYRSLVFKHSKKASNILTSPIRFPNGYGDFYEVYGNVGTPSQVFFSDSLDQHLVMASFYYNQTLQNDSLRPATNFLKKELKKMAESISWK